MTLGEGIFNVPKEANSKRIAKIFDRRGRYPPRPNDLFLGIRAHLDSYAQDKKLKVVCACKQEFTNLKLMLQHRKESHDNN
jgi:hypothetical protein